MKERDTLVVISVPFTRNARYLLVSKIFDKLKNTYDVLVVGPQFGQKSLREEFGGPRVSFWEFDQRLERLNRGARYLYGISELLRRNGYLFRFRRRGLAYLWNYVTRVTLDESGERVVPSSSRILNRILGVLGYPRFAWRVVDQLCGGLMFDSQVFAERTCGYNHIIILQTANWGYQERYLAYCTRRYSLKSILIPYTTDQLITNGYLATAYDKICAQGPVEKSYAIKYHGITEDRVVPLGMIWRRNLESIQHEYNMKRPSWKPEENTIMYAGMASNYFPRKSEFLAVDSILDAIRDGRLPKAKLIYRPVVNDAREAEAIRKKYAGESLITIQIPQAAFIGVDQSNADCVRPQIIGYLEQLTQANVLVMSATTTMMFDALHFEIPCVANFADPTSMLQEVGFTTTYIENDDTLRGSRSTPIAFSLDDLIGHIHTALLSPASAGQAKKEVFGMWDYQNGDYVRGCLEVIESLTA